MALLALLELRKAGEVTIEQAAPFAPIRVGRFEEREELDRPLRLIAANPLDRLARTLEALLVVTSRPLSAEELAAAADDDAERVETALGLVAERFREGRSGIVLEKVAGGWAFRAAREAAEACERLVERPVERGLSQAALETLAIVAYLGPCTRPEIARIRGVSADGVVAGLVERGLVVRGRPPRGRRPLPHDGAVRARLRPREPVAAAAPRRPRRERRRDPRAPRGGRGEPARLAPPIRLRVAGSELRARRRSCVPPTA